MRKTLMKCQSIKNPVDVEIHSTLKGLCKDKGWSYNWLKTLKLPFGYKGFMLERLKDTECPSGQKWT